jgi:hypothetical protein
LATRGHIPHNMFMELDEAAPDVTLPMDRPLFSPPFRADLSNSIVIEGDQNFVADALFDQVYVDKERLAANVRWALQTHAQISLEDLVAMRPLEQGLAEVVAYLSLAAEMNTAIIDDHGKQTLCWTDGMGNRRQVTLPLIIFSRMPRAGPLLT